MKNVFSLNIGEDYDADEVVVPKSIHEIFYTKKDAISYIDNEDNKNLYLFCIIKFNMIIYLCRYPTYAYYI